MIATEEWGDESLPLPHDDVIREHAYLIARGVRTIAIVDAIEAKPWLMERVATRLERLSDGQSIPFVMDRGDGMADIGYAAQPWAIELLKWVMRADIPVLHKNRIVGLLLGYSSEAVQRYENAGVGRMYTRPNA